MTTSEIKQAEPVAQCRGYALLGAGNYLLNHSDDFHPELGVELIITLAAEKDKEGNRQIGETRDNPNHRQPIQPEDMVVRIGFLNERGLFALENQLSLIRKQFFADHPAPAVAQEPVAFCVEFGGAQLGMPVMNRRDAEAIAALIPSRRKVVDLFREAPAVAQGEPVGFRYKTRSIKYPENGWSGWHFQEGVPANYHLTDDGNFEFLTRLLYDHSTPAVAQPPAEVVRELVEAANQVFAIMRESEGIAGYHMNGAVAEWDSLTEVWNLEAALKSAKEHGL